MAITVNGPNGLTVNFPDGTDSDTIHSVMMKASGQGETPAAAKEPQTSALGAAGRGALQGLTFNTADEISSAGQAAYDKVFGSGDYSGTYDKALKSARDANKQAETEHPGAYLAGEFGGSLPVAAGLTAAAGLFPGAAPAAAAVDAKTAAQAASLGSKAWQGIKTGAGIGAAYGVGGAESAPDSSLGEAALNRLGGGLKGGAIGGAVGGVAAPAIDFLGGLSSGIRTQYNALANPVGFGRQKYGEAIARGYSDSPNPLVAAKVDAANTALASPNAVFGDVGGDPVKTLIKTALNRPNAQNEPFLQMLKARAGNQWQEVEDNLRKYMADPESFEPVKTALESSQAADAHPAYDAAFKAEFKPSDALMNLFEQNDKGQFIRPTMGNVVNRVGKNIADKYGSNYADWADENGLKFIQQTKQQLDKQIGEAQKGVNVGRPFSADKNALESLLDLRGQLANGIDKSTGDAVPLYQQADKNWSNAEALKNAMDLGRSHAQKPSDVIRSAWDEMGPAEQDHYRLGLARGLADKNQVGGIYRDRVGRDWRDPQDQLRIPAMMGNNATGFNQALDAMESGRNLQNRAFGESSTAKQIFSNDDAKQEIEDLFHKGGMLKDALTQNHAGLLSKALMATKKQLQGMNPRVAEEILRIAQSPAGIRNGSAQISDVLEAAQNHALDQHSAQIQRQMLTNSISRGVSSTTNNDNRGTVGRQTYAR